MKKVNLFFGIIIFFVIVGSISGLLEAREYTEEINYYAVATYLFTKVIGIVICWGVVIGIIWVIQKIKKK